MRAKDILTTSWDQMRIYHKYVKWIANLALRKNLNINQLFLLLLHASNLLYRQLGDREQSLTNSWKHWRGRGSPAFLNPRDWPSCKKMDLNPVSVIWICLHLFCASCYTLFECCQQREITIQAVSKWSRKYSSVHQCALILRTILHIVQEIRRETRERLLSNL